MLNLFQHLSISQQSCTQDPQDNQVHLALFSRKAGFFLRMTWIF
ncbi:MAG: hypothetical protein ABIO46_12985 [Chitinophagales bacterium]